MIFTRTAHFLDRFANPSEQQPTVVTATLCNVKEGLNEQKENID